MELTKIPTVKVTSTSVVLYDEWNGAGRRKNDPLYNCTSELDLGVTPGSKVADNLHSNVLSFKALSRIKKSINTLLWLTGTVHKTGNKIGFFSAHKVTFATLTLSSTQCHTDNYIKSKLLNQLFTELRKRYKKLLYVWRQEFQENGNIHFHILLNRFIPWQLLRKKWNRLQLNNGYLQDYQSKHANLTFADYLKLYPASPLRPKHVLYKAYLYGVRTKWTDPNSTDIHSLKKVSNISAYICKYLTKQSTVSNFSLQNLESLSDFRIELEMSRALSCSRSWFASSEISKFQYPTEIIDGKIEREIDKLFKSANIFHSVYETTVVFAISPIKLFNLGFYVLFKLFYDKITEFKSYKTI